MKKVFANAIFITFVAIGVTWATMWFFAQMTYGFVPVEALLKSSLVAVLIAFPTGLLLEAQKKQLAEASARLRRSQCKLRAAMREVKRNSERDFLTSVLNRGSFLQRLEKRYEAGEEGALLMIDADDFKSINDQFGHAAGDQALTLIADAISMTIGDGGLVGRMGGEEFAVFMPAADRQEARETAEKIRREIGETEFWPTEHRRHALSVSIGGELMTGQVGFSCALAKADERMYQAKRFGKNRCKIPPTETAGTAPVTADQVAEFETQRVA
ncbi:MAG: GGDEF domain-containing protein [Rhizobiaceae bacterium]